MQSIGTLTEIEAAWLAEIYITRRAERADQRAQA
jgi:hypothetical protein